MAGDASLETRVEALESIIKNAKTLSSLEQINELTPDHNLGVHAAGQLMQFISIPNLVKHIVSSITTSPKIDNLSVINGKVNQTEWEVGNFFIGKNDNGDVICGEVIALPFVLNDITKAKIFFESANI